MNFLTKSFIFLFFISSKIFFGQEALNIFKTKDSLQEKIYLNEIKDLSDLSKTLNKHGYYFFKSQLTKKDSTNTYIIDLGIKTSVVAIKGLPPVIQKIFKTIKDTYYTTPQELSKWIEKIINHYDNKGENFTEVKLKNQKLQNDTLYCNLAINSSTKREIDRTVIKGYKRFPKRFTKHYIRSKKPFSKELLSTTEKKINQLTFVKNKKTPAVLFTNDSTFLYLYIDPVKTNKLDALLGFSNQEGESKLKFNGYIDISLTNTVHKGETFAFKWNNTGEDQQEVNLKIDNPYIFNSPINTGYNLNTYRKDSSFVNTQHQFIIGYRPHYKHLINSYYNSERSATLNTSNNNIAEYQKKVFGIQYNYTELNNIRLPKIKAIFDIGVGTKKTPTTNTKQQSFSSDLIYSLELTPSNHFYIQNRNAYLRAPNKHINELYRTGGATTIRGFLEQSILAHLYNYTNLEYRYFTNPISYLYGFSDIGYFKNLAEKNNLLSFGLGYTLGTQTGLLKISYALGKTQNSTFDINKGLFHINFVTIF